MLDLLFLSAHPSSDQLSSPLVSRGQMLSLAYVLALLRATTYRTLFWYMPPYEVESSFIKGFFFLAINPLASSKLRDHLRRCLTPPISCTLF